MSDSKKFVFKNKHIAMLFVIIFGIIALFSSLGCYKYYKQVEKTVTEESADYMTEITNRIGANSGKIFQDNFSVLGTIASAIQLTENFDLEAWQSIAKAQQDYWKFSSAMLISEQGSAIDGNGERFELFNDTFMLDALIDRKVSMSAAQNIGGKESIIFIMPIDVTLSGLHGVKSLALATSYELSTFDKILSLSAFDGKCYAHIIRNDGVVVIRSSSVYARDSGYNLLNSLETAKFRDGKTLQNIRMDIVWGIGGMTEYSQDDAKEYMIYTPLSMKGWTLVSFVPVAVVNQKSQILLSTTLLLSSIVATIFVMLMAALMLTFFINKRKLERLVYVDSITGGHTMQKFNQLVQEVFNKNNKDNFAIVYLNIEKFKVFNEQYGRKQCDKILKILYESISENLGEKECIGRLVADTFCVFVKFDGMETLLSRFDEWYMTAEQNSVMQNTNWMPIIIDCGVYPIDDENVGIPHMVDRAKLALTKSSRDIRGKVRYAVYDDNVRKKLFREKHLEDIMESALKHDEFQVFLQPKYNSSDEKISGAEALVRWQNIDGMIYPDEFIALFEKNGFIIQLDLFVFETVCKTIKKWIDNNLKPIKISVNCSRVHLKYPNFFEEYCSIAAAYNVPPSLIEIELTESMMFEDVNKIKQVINQIHEAGFGCSMDDFGSGYSSFNLLQEIPVDTIKLDKIFFSKGKNIERTESVVSGIISMSKSLNMLVVAEGVEERAHVDMLKRLKCDFIQGYFFAKPMPIVDFEVLAY